MLGGLARTAAGSRHRASARRRACGRRCSRNGSRGRLRRRRGKAFPLRHPFACGRRRWGFLLQELLPGLTGHSLGLARIQLRRPLESADLALSRVLAYDIARLGRTKLQNCHVKKVINPDPRTDVIARRAFNGRSRIGRGNSSLRNASQRDRVSRQCSDSIKHIL